MFTCYSSCQHKRNGQQQQQQTTNHPFPKRPTARDPPLPLRSQTSPGAFDDALNDPKHNTWEPWFGQKSNAEWVREVLKPPPGQKRIFVGVLSKWREQKDGGAQRFLGVSWF